MPARDLPHGTLTFLFSDIEGSTQLWERHAHDMQAALARHDEILRSAVGEHNGIIVKTTGDGAYAVFAAASDGLRAAVAAQKRLQTESWTQIEPDIIRSRMGIHSGEAEIRDGDYHGIALNIAARLMAAGHGGQVLLSDVTADLAHFPDGFVWKELGRYRLKGISEPQRVLQLVAPDLPASFPPLNALNTAVRNLPGQQTAFVGRRRELSDLRRLLLKTDTRLLTLTGPGGIGKTRTAIELARAAAAEFGESFPDGVVFVPLAPVDSGAVAIRTMADALGFSFGSDDIPQSRQLLVFLSDKRLLLLLDNLEHLLGEGLATFLSDLLSVAPDVTLLATSRERANLQGETVYALSGMDGDHSEAVADSFELDEASAPDAVRLFLQSARRVIPDFIFSEENARAIARIGRLTGGMPLGIELAAGWLTVLSPQEIATELENSFDLLSTTVQDVPQRQRSLRAVFEGSWQLLSRQEQEAFLRLSVFRGGFQREEGQLVAGVALPVLLSLINISFLQRTVADRFELHEQLRYFANELLRQDAQAWEAAKTAHSTAFGDFLTRQSLRLRSEQQLPALAEIEREFDNIRVAWEWHVSQSAFDVLVERFLPALFRYASLRMLFTELEVLLEAALDRLAATPGGQETVHYVIMKTAVIDLFLQRLITAPLHYPGGKVLLQAMWPVAVANQKQMGEWFDLFLKHHMHHLQEDDAYQLWEAHIAGWRASGESWLLARSLQMLAVAIFLTRWNLDQPFDFLDEAFILFQHARDRFEVAQTLYDLGWMMKWTGDLVRAEAYLQEAQQHLIGYSEVFRHTNIFNELREIYLKQGRLDKAFAITTAEQQHFQRVNRLDLLKESLHWESINASRHGSLERAFKAREKSMVIGRKIARAMPGEEAPGLAWDYFELGELYRLSGDFEQARRYFGMAQTIFDRTSDAHGRAYSRRAQGDLALDEKQFEQAEAYFRYYVTWARESRRLWELIQGCTGLGRALCGLGRYEESAENLYEALELADNPAIIDMALLAITAVAELHVAEEDYTKGALLAAFVLQHPLSWIEMRTRAERLLRDLRPRLESDFNVATAAEVAARTLVPELNLTYLG